MSSFRKYFNSSIESVVLREICNHARSHFRETDPDRIFTKAAGKIYEKVKESKRSDSLIVIVLVAVAVTAHLKMQ
jgi:hypothetical protein